MSTTSAAAAIGLGVRGGAESPAAFLGRGVALTVWNRSLQAAAALGDLGATVARTPAAAARHADTDLVLLRDGTALEEVPLGPDGVGHGPSMRGRPMTVSPHRSRGRD